jgi:SAM-dependent methyltransferase
LDESFDVVIGTCALEHFFFPQMGLREMHRVARSRGRIILFGPCWDLPYWFPPSVKRRMSSWKSRLRYTTSRLTGQIWGWLSGRLPFHCVEEPEVLTESFKCDEDAVYVVWVYEVLAYMQKLGFRCTHLAIYDKFLGRNALIRSIKRLLYLLPIYKCGGAFLALFEKT